MTDKPYVPSTEQVRSDATQLMDRDSFDRWLADIKMTERLFMLTQIMDVADFDPGQKDEYGRTEIPAYIAIDVYELNEIARLEDQEFMAITAEDLEKHASVIEADAEQRGHLDGWDEVLELLENNSEIDPDAVDHYKSLNPIRINRADQMEGDDE